MLFSDTDDPYFSVAGRELSLASRIAPSRQKNYWQRHDARSL